MCKWERFTNFLNKDVVKIHKEKKKNAPIFKLLNDSWNDV